MKLRSEMDLKTGGRRPEFSWTQSSGPSETESALLTLLVRSSVDSSSPEDNRRGWVWWIWAWWRANANRAPAAYLCVGVKNDVVAMSLRELNSWEFGDFCVNCSNYFAVKLIVTKIQSRENWQCCCWFNLKPSTLSSSWLLRTRDSQPRRRFYLLAHAATWRVVFDTFAACYTSHFKLLISH